MAHVFFTTYLMVWYQYKCRQDTWACSYTDPLVMSTLNSNRSCHAILTRLPYCWVLTVWFDLTNKLYSLLRFPFFVKSSIQVVLPMFSLYVPFSLLRLKESPTARRTDGERKVGAGVDQSREGPNSCEEYSPHACSKKKYSPHRAALNLWKWCHCSGGKTVLLLFSFRASLQCMLVATSRVITVLRS
jgi:hypothetical protein